MRCEGGKNVRQRLRPVSYTHLISKKIKDGEDIAGQSFAYGLKEGAVGIPSENPNLADGVYDKTMEVQKLIEAGEITPPSTEEEFNQFGK